MIVELGRLDRTTAYVLQCEAAMRGRIEWLRRRAGDMAIETIVWHDARHGAAVVCARYPLVLPIRV